VLAGQPVEGEVTEYEDFTGRADAKYTVEVRARVTGFLDKIHFEDGSEVNTDDLLFEIDPRPYQAAFDRAAANLAQAQAKQKRVEADFQRKENLRTRGMISREEYYLAADDLAEGRAGVGIAKADRDVAKLNLDFTKVQAPIAGRISRRLVDVGNLISADVTPLTTIVTLDPLYAYFDIDERTVLRIRQLIAQGKMQSRTEAAVPVYVALANEDDYYDAKGNPIRIGMVDFSENRLDPNTGTLRVRAVIPNPIEQSRRALGGHVPRAMSPGMFLRIRLPIGKPHQALMVAEQALSTDQGRKFLYVVNDKDEVVRHNVSVGPLNKGMRVIEAGLKPGERVIVSGLQRVRPGGKVVAKPAEQYTTLRSSGGPGDGREAVARRPDAVFTPPTGG